MTDIFILSSEDRNNGTVSNGNVKISNSIDGEYKLAEFIMPNHIYNVSDKNNKIFFQESATPFTATLTNGSYNIVSDFTAEVKSAMEVVSALTYTVTYNTLTNKLTFVPSAGTFGFLFLTNTTNTSRFLLGKNKIDDIEAGSITSDIQIDLNPNKIIYFKLFSKNNITTSSGVETTFFISIDSFFTEVFRKNFTDYNILFNFNKAINFEYTMQDSKGNELTQLDASSNWNIILKKT